MWRHNFAKCPFLLTVRYFFLTWGEPWRFYSFRSVGTDVSWSLGLYDMLWRHCPIKVNSQLIFDILLMTSESAAGFHFSLCNWFACQCPHCFFLRVLYFGRYFPPDVAVTSGTWPFLSQLRESRLTGTEDLLNNPEPWLRLTASDKQQGGSSWYDWSSQKAAEGNPGRCMWHIGPSPDWKTV